MLYHADLLRQALEIFEAEYIESVACNPNGVAILFNDNIGIALTYVVDGYIELRCKCGDEWRGGVFIGTDLQTLITDAFDYIYTSDSPI